MAHSRPNDYIPGMRGMSFNKQRYLCGIVLSVSVEAYCGVEAFLISKIKRINKKGHPAIAYLHPWEFDMEQPKMDLPLSRSFMHYFNLKSAPGKVEGLLRNFKFAPVRDVLSLGSGS